MTAATGHRPATWLALAVWLSGTAWGAAPSYSAAGVVNAGNSAPGPFAPNSVLTIYGADLAPSERKLTAGDIGDGRLPTELNCTRVYVDNAAAPLLYVSPTQINFLVPPNQSIVLARIRVVTNLGYGPEVAVNIVDGAPALFVMPGGYVIATHADNSLIAADAPAHPGEVVVLYLTGLGKTAPNPQPGEIPKSAAAMLHWDDLKVRLDGTSLDASLIEYAGLTPGSPGLYQINLALPEKTGADPEIRVSVGDQISPAGAKLAVR